MTDLWKRVKFGAPPVFDDPKQLWDLATEYFDWCKSNTIDKPEHHKIKESQGPGQSTDVIELHYLPLPRAMTLSGLWSHANIRKSTWYNYKKNPEFLEVIEAIEEVMREQKFSGAAAGLFNANIIARDLGLTDKTESTVVLADDFDSLLDDAADD